MIPATPGLYRFRAPGVPGLLYIGESGAHGGRAARLDDLARGRRHTPNYLNWRANGLAKRPHRGHYAAPFIRQAQEATGRIVEVSWVLVEHADKVVRKATEGRLLAVYQDAMRCDPPVQHGGRGMAAWLIQHTTGTCTPAGYWHDHARPIPLSRRPLPHQGNPHRQRPHALDLLAHPTR